MTFRVAYLALIALLNVAHGTPLPIDKSDKNADVQIIERTPLFLKGTAIHRRLIFRVYELSLYLQDLNTPPEGIIAAVELKYARMRFLRSLSADTLRKAFQESYSKNCLDQCVSSNSQLQFFLNTIRDVEDGDVIEFTFFSDHMLVTIPGLDSVSIPGIEFGKIILRTWMGPFPPSERFKRELLRSI